MAIIGQGVQAGLGRIDYTPYLQGASIGAQGIAQGIAGLGKSTADAIQEYQKNKAANEILEAENTRYLAYMERNPEMKGYAPDPSVIDKFRDKMLKGGLTLTDNRKLNAELNVAIKLHDRDREQERQQAYMDQVKESTKKMRFDLAQAEQDRNALNTFNTALSQLSEGEGTPERIQEIGRSLGTPSAIVNTALSGRLDVGRYEISLAAQRANNIRNQVETELLNRQLEIARNANPNGKVELIEQDGNQVIKMTDQSGKIDFKLVPREKPTKQPPEDALSSLVQKYQIGQATNNPILINAAITEYADVMGFKGPGWSAETIGAELAGLAAKVPFKIPPPRGGAGITSAKPVSVEQKAPGSAAAPAAPSKQEVPVKTAGGQAVAQPQLPPQPSTPPSSQQVAMNTQQALAAAPQAPVVDTNLFVETPSATAPRATAAGFNYPAMSVLGGAERLARFLGPVEQQIAAPGRLINELGRYGGAIMTGTMPSQGIVDTASEGMARLLSGSNAVGETVRTLGMPFGTVPEGVGQAVFDRPSNSVQATMEALSSGMRPSRGRDRPAQAATAPRPMQSAELPQIQLSKDAKRIANMLLQEYENNKGGKPPTFTITATSPGGKETSIKLSNPEILAVMSNPTNFGGIIRGGQEAFTRQNAEMNRIMQEMLTARQAELARRRANRAR